mmetsp:Transcript_7137/g.31402  ORF Transcript_7137/g.31402 Transcript_7137/m.31402 type:complete len:233 (+) Transcript_7137:930-1628(+)
MQEHLQAHLAPPSGLALDPKVISLGHSFRDADQGVPPRQRVTRALGGDDHGRLVAGHRAGRKLERDGHHLETVHVHALPLLEYVIPHAGILVGFDGDVHVDWIVERVLEADRTAAGLPERDEDVGSRELGGFRASSADGPRPRARRLVRRHDRPGLQLVEAARSVRHPKLADAEGGYGDARRRDNEVARVIRARQRDKNLLVQGVLDVQRGGPARAANLGYHLGHHGRGCVE